MRYQVTFLRVGRFHNVPPLVTDARNRPHLAAQIKEYVKPYLYADHYRIQFALDDGDLLGGQIRLGDGEQMDAGMFRVEALVCWNCGGGDDTCPECQPQATTA